MVKTSTQKHSNSNFDQEKYLRKRGPLVDYISRLSGAENFEEMANHIIDAVIKTIDTDMILVGYVKLGFLQAISLIPEPNSPPAKEIPFFEPRPRARARACITPPNRSSVG